MFDGAPGDASGGDAEELLSGVTLVARFVDGFDPLVWSSGDAATLVGVLSRLERLAVSARLLAAGRVASGNGWRDSGHSSAEQWLAEQAGTSCSDAAAVLATAAVLGDCPGTEAALRQGRLSTAQAVAVTSAASVDPAAEEALLVEAGNSTVESLQRSARRVRASATPDDGLAARERTHRQRYVRTWTDDEGACNGRFRLTGDAGAVVTAALDAFREPLFREARARGLRERPDALCADALVAMARAATGAPDETAPDATPDGRDRGGPAPGPARRVTGPGRRGPQATVVVRVDHAALVRGHTVAGEECTIDGAGPVPVATARRLACDAVLTALLVDGDRIVDVRTVGRTIPHRLRMALTARDRCCVIPGCDVARHLEIHHLDPVARDGPTSLDNTCRICSWHHDQITYRGADLMRSGAGWVYAPGADDPGADRSMTGGPTGPRPTWSATPPTSGTIAVPGPGPVSARDACMAGGVSAWVVPDRPAIDLVRVPGLTTQAPYAYAAAADGVRRLVFTAGACPLDAEGAVVALGDVAGQAAQVMANLTAALGAAGAGLHDVVKTTVYVATTDRHDLVAAWDVVSATFGDHDAPSTLLGVTVLGYPGQLVEVEAVAVLW